MTQAVRTLILLDVKITRRSQSMLNVKYILRSSKAITITSGIIVGSNFGLKIKI